MKKSVLILVIIAACFISSYAQQWEPVQNSVVGKVLGGYVLKGDLFVFSMQQSCIAIYKKQDNDFIEAGKMSENFEMSTNNTVFMVASSTSCLYIVFECPKRNVFRVYMWDGKEIKNISPKSISIQNLASAVYHNGSLYVSANNLNDTSSYVVQWFDNKWNSIATPEEFWGPGNFFVYNKTLYCILNDPYYGSSSIFSFTGNVWTRIMKSNTELQEVYSVHEYNEQMFIFDGANNRYFLFTGTSLAEKSCKLKFDNYGSTPCCMIYFHDKLFIGGQFWSDIEASPSVLFFNAKKWNAAGNGVSSWIRSFAVYEDNLYIFGDLESTGDIELKNIARYKE